jgi:hypothetical protein
MDERIRVHHFDGGREQPTVTRAPSCFVRGRDEHRAKPFPPTDEAVPDGVGNAWLDASELRCAQVYERLIDRGAVEREAQRGDVSHEGR